MAIATGLTIEEFEQLPQALVRHCELVDGELVDVSGNTGEHNDLRGLLEELLRPPARRMGGQILAEQEFDFGGNAHGPDVSMIGAEKRRLYNRKRRVQPFVPDLAIEIVSSNDKFDAITRKAKRYLESGTAEVWVFSIENRLALHLSPRRQVILTDEADFAPELLPDVRIRIGELLDRLA